MKLNKLLRPGMLSFAIQRVCTWYVVRLPVARLIARRRPQGLRSDAPRQSAEIVRALERDGYSMLPRFVDEDTVKRIHDHLRGAVLSERFAARRAGFIIDEVPENVHVAEYQVEHLLKSPDIVALTHNPVLLDVATRYLGCRPTMSNLSLWWSLPADGTAQEAENYHRDVDDWRFVKFFLYLSEVDATAGPHRFVRGSHKSSHFLFIRRLTDKAVERVFGRSHCLPIFGRPGDAFLEDTFGLHKGEPPSVNRRLVFQIQYSINPIPVYDYHPRLIEQEPAKFDPYMARLYMVRAPA
jgi:Phytanoyl-CoA dioxygenase (PhyH)